MTADMYQSPEMASAFWHAYLTRGLQKTFAILREACILSGWTGAENWERNGVWRHPQNELEYYAPEL